MDGSPPLPHRAQRHDVVGPATTAQEALGEQLSLHRGESIGRLTWLLVALPGTALVILLLGYGLWRGYYGYTRYGMVAAIGWSRPWLAAGIGVGLLIVIWLLIRWQASRRFVAVHEGGIRVHSGSRGEIWLSWPDVAGVTIETSRRHVLGLTVKRSQQLTVHPKSRSPIRLDDGYQDLDTLILELKDRYYANIGPELARRFRAGRSVRFGPLSVDQRGIALRGRQTPWAEIESLRLETGSLMITRNAGRPLRIPARRIPNLEVLLHILHEGGPHEAISKEDRPQGAAHPA